MKSVLSEIPRHWIKHGLLLHPWFLNTSPVAFSQVGIAAHACIPSSCGWKPLEVLVVMCYVISSGEERWGVLMHCSRSGLSPRGSALSLVWLIRAVCVHETEKRGRVSIWGFNQAIMCTQRDSMMLKCEDRKWSVFAGFLSVWGLTSLSRCSILSFFELHIFLLEKWEYSSLMYNNGIELLSFT